MTLNNDNVSVTQQWPSEDERYQGQLATTKLALLKFQLKGEGPASYRQGVDMLFVTWIICLQFFGKGFVVVFNSMFAIFSM